MSVREIEGYLNRVEEIKNSENAFLNRMRSERLQKEERYASPERKREIKQILKDVSEVSIVKVSEKED